MDPSAAPNPISTSTAPPAPKPKRHRFFNFAPSFWAQTSALPITPTAVANVQPNPPAQSTKASPDTTDSSQTTPALSEQTARTADSDCRSDKGSQSSLSGSDEASDDGDDTQASDPSHPNAAPSARATRLAERVEFPHPVNAGEFLILYRASLPIDGILASLAERGTWAVIMSGGGHFCAALWDVRGTLMKHKTFHRYTSRRKQGGSQAAADEARGNAK